MISALLRRVLLLRRKCKLLMALHLVQCLASLSANVLAAWISEQRTILVIAESVFFGFLSLQVRIIPCIGTMPGHSPRQILHKHASSAGPLKKLPFMTAFGSSIFTIGCNCLLNTIAKGHRQTCTGHA